MIRYLLDTNASIEIIRDRSGRVARRASVYLPEEIGLPMIAVHELYFWAYKSSRVAESLSVVDELAFPLVPFEREDARVSGEVRVLLRRAGLTIGHYDTLIAGQALARGLVLVTHNVREFERVPGLRMEDWEA